jgi:hypothetical protein
MWRYLEALGKVETGRGIFRRADNSNVRVGSDLERTETAAHDSSRSYETTVGFELGRRPEEDST